MLPLDWLSNNNINDGAVEHVMSVVMLLNN